MEWPDYFRRCDNTVIVNANGELALNKDAKNNSMFKTAEKTGQNKIKCALKFGMSKDSPFHGEYTFEHPSTKHVLDYAYMSKVPVDVIATQPYH